jgi:ADP-ribosylglycohydrolase
MQNKNHLQNILYGVVVGDALGVPVEFKSREYLKQNPVNTMLGFGSHNVRAGVWSDDSSLTFCLAESINEGLNLQQLANKFVAWKYNNYWTPEGKVFDIGIATSKAIERLAKGENPELAGGLEESDNGNGSLMRILPLVLYSKDKSISERFQITKQVSSLTHGHIRSVIACFYYLEFAKQIIEGKDKFEIYENLKREVPDFLKLLNINPDEIAMYNRLLNGNIHEEDEIKSSGYVVHTLEASIWCLLTTNNYVDAVLNAVNLGDDTDTTGAVTGGLAGMLYGFEMIPQTWIDALAKLEEINQLIYSFHTNN